jgi:NAD-dependent dihydropyrimidine dehydrogenase PreA subunit
MPKCGARLGNEFGAPGRKIVDHILDALLPTQTLIQDGRPGFNGVEQLYIDPVECIDCGACVPVCPVSAIFALDDLPEKWQRFTEINASYAVGGKFQGDKFQKRAA